jgi:TolB protein
MISRYTAFLLLALLMALVSAGSLRAQGDNIRNIYFDTIRSSDARPIRVAVENMKYVGTDYINGGDSLILGNISTVVRNDLDFSSYLDLVQEDSVFMKMYEIKVLNLLAWERLGADRVVRLEAEFNGPNIRAQWRIFETTRQTETDKGMLIQGRYAWRELAHDIANEIVHAITGDRGIFRTQIAFMKKTSSGKELYVSDYDGANERIITRTGTINVSPCFSPDGSEVFFTSFLDGDPHLYKAEVLSGKVSKVAAFPGIVAAPSIAPDGKRIAVVLSKDGNSEIYILDLQGRVIKRVTNHKSIDTSPTWSPDGRHIAFASDRTGAPQVYITDDDGQTLRRLTYEGDYNDSPIWSQRGDRITFVSRTKSGRFDLASIDTSGADYRVLTQIGMNENPHFSPDGRQLVFSSNRIGTGDLYTADITGRNQRRLTKSGGYSNPVWGPLK